MFGKINIQVTRRVCDGREAATEAVATKRPMRAVCDESNHDRRRAEQLKMTVWMIVGKESIRIKHAFGNKA